MLDLSSLSDEQLFENGIPTGDTLTELISRYMPLVFSSARKLSQSADYEELVSDGLQALLGAINGFSAERGRFAAFAKVCVNNRLINTAQKCAKHNAKFLGEDELEKLSDNSPSPEEIVLEQESSRELIEDIQTILTDLESKCIQGVVLGLSYTDIAKQLGVERKTVDNALSRARTKLKKRRKET